jgi:enamine deaminase RidA (YjgF/YER057c/UK114 family)
MRSSPGKAGIPSRPGPNPERDSGRWAIAEQTRVTLRNLAAILERLGADASAVVSCTCYLADLQAERSLGDHP